MTVGLREDMLERERVANRRKHWVRLATACNSRCLFCLDSDTPRNVLIPVDVIKRELDRGREELDADKVILSGGEASLHPQFPDMVRYAKEIGYDRVQTVTNGFRFADPDFYRQCVEAGLGEITFSLHGHTPELHDRLTGTPDAFKHLMKAMIRAVRDGRLIVNVDVVINKQNVAVIDRIVELCIGVGITEFDLLHVIPQAAAFENRDELFYDPREHLPVLQKVFRLNRHPDFVVWTNRFPISFLEGLEDLIQDPHKMLDEANGRRFQIRRYLDEGTPLDCRQPERCVHCFMEPLCTTTDRMVAAQNQRSWDVWWVGDASEAGELPYGCRRIGIEVGSAAEVPDAPAYVRVKPGVVIPLPAGGGAIGHIAVADSAALLDAWLGAGGHVGTTGIEIQLNRSTAPWILGHRDLLAAQLDRVRIHQPSHERLSEAAENDVRDPRAFFAGLALPVRVSGLPACLAPGTVLVEELRILPRSLFGAESGRPEVKDLAQYHVRERYRAKSLRCSTCVVNDRCEGIHVNMIRDQGLALAQPLARPWADEASRQLRERWPEPPRRLADGLAPQAVAESLPGFAPPGEAPPDPLIGIVAEQRRARESRRAR